MLISWLYYPENGSPCAESRDYELDLYSRMPSSGDMQFLERVYLMVDSIRINSSLLYSQDDDTLLYFKVSVLTNDSNEACATTEYLHTFSDLGTVSSKNNIAIGYGVCYSLINTGLSHVDAPNLCGTV